MSFRAASSLIAVVVGVTALLAAITATPSAHSPGRTGSASRSASTTTRVPTTNTSPSTTSPLSAERHVSLRCLSSSPTTGVFEVTTAPGSTPAFYVTHDFSNFTKVTTPIPSTIPTPAWAVCTTFLTTSTVGWATKSVRGPDPVEGALYETTDAGRHWHLVRRLGCGGAVPWAWVKFVNPSDGWLAAGAQGSNCDVFQRTQDGGRTWQTLPATELQQPPVFVSPSAAFVVDYQDMLQETTDAGLSWHRVRVPVTLRGHPMLGVPLFSGTDGVVPLIVSKTAPSILTSDEPVRVTVTFDTTTDGGRSWVPGPRVRADAPTGLSGPSSNGLPGTIVAGPAVGVSSPKNWWIVAVRPTGQVYAEVTNDAGRHWDKPAGDGLPILDVATYRTHQMDWPVPRITPVSSQIAIAAVQTSVAEGTYYVTTDGGARWSSLTAMSF